MSNVQHGVPIYIEVSKDRIGQVSSTAKPEQVCRHGDAAIIPDGDGLHTVVCRSCLHSWLKVEEWRP